MTKNVTNLAYVAGGGLGAVVLFGLLGEGPVMVGLGAPHGFLSSFVFRAL